MGVPTNNQIPVLVEPQPEPLVITLPPVVLTLMNPSINNYPDNPFMNFVSNHYFQDDPEFVCWFYWSQFQAWEHDTPDLETTEFIRHIHYLQFEEGGMYNWQENPVGLGLTHDEVRDLLELDQMEEYGPENHPSTYTNIFDFSDDDMSDTD